MVGTTATKQVATQPELDQLCVNTIRTLAIDGVQQANSGHPGAPLGMAPMAYVLWMRHLRFNPKNPTWFNRDRFILSAGHASMLLYSLLHLTGYDVSLEQLKSFRQWGSKTPGHPEYGLTPGVETTTGPLGQGFATAVGMAMGERWLAAHFNQPDLQIVDHHTYIICSDGDLMEGISHEAASLAGHLKLGKLICLYDDNNITIEGEVSLTCSDDAQKRFESYGWHTQRVTDGNNIAAIDEALKIAKAETRRPSLIMVQTHIGYGSPSKQDSPEAHGSPLGEEEVKRTKTALGWPDSTPFYVPKEALELFRQAVKRGQSWEDEWQSQLESFVRQFPELAEEWYKNQAGILPFDWQSVLPSFVTGTEMATRSASGKVLNALAEKLSNLIGGSADLAPSNNTELVGYGHFGAENYGGRNLHFGIREHAMGAILNGLSLYGGIRPYGATFLVFSDYMRPAIRLAALMRQPVIYIFTHDSIGLGEDGPTHQPVEHLATLRAIPNLMVLRPADANETVEAWRTAIERRNGPTALIFSRQNLPTLKTRADRQGKPGQGAYILAEASGGIPQIILLGSGSEVTLCLAAREQLEAQNIPTRVVSMLSMELFEEQPKEYREQVLPYECQVRIAVETGVGQGWDRYVGLRGEVIGLENFGASAPYKLLMQKFGFSVENVVFRAVQLIAPSR